MFRKIMSVLVVAAMFMAVTGVAHADEKSEDKSLTRGAASLVLPGWGQYLNNEIENKTGKLKTATIHELSITLSASFERYSSSAS